MVGWCETWGLIKSIHGGGGKGTAHLTHPDKEPEVPGTMSIEKSGAHGVTITSP